MPSSWSATMNRSKTVRIIEISELVGVSKQRVHQIAGEDGSRLQLGARVRAAYGIGAR